MSTRFVRFTILKTTGRQPCLDELEVYGPDAPAKNVALAENGTIARASGTLPEYGIHTLRHVNDGIFGNGHSWISDTDDSGWVELELAAPVRITRIVWSRDREGKFIDRLATEYRVEVATEPGVWQVVSSSANRVQQAVLPTLNPAFTSLVARVSPATTEQPGATRAAARGYLLETWQTSRGLPANTVTSVLQTRDGWLWVGTTNGLARFDGVRFHPYGEREGLPSLSVWCMFEDSRGTLWIGTDGGGLAKKDGGIFSPVSVGDAPMDRRVFSIAEDSTGALWIGTAGGLLEIRDGTLARRHKGLVPRVAADKGGVFFLNGNQVERWDGKAMMPLPYDIEPSRFSALTALAIGPDGGMWFGGANGYVGRFANDAVTTFGEGHAALTSNAWELLPTRGGDVWVGTAATGLGRLRGSELLQITTDDGLPSNSVRALCEDREGNVWVGTAGGGLTRLSQRRVASLTTRDGLSHNYIMSMVEDAAGTVWIGTNGGGLNRWHSGKAEPHAPSFVLENKIVAAIATQSDGSLWLGTSDRGLFHLSGQKVEPLDTADGLPGNAVVAMCPDAADGLWIGTLDGGPAFLSAGKITLPPSIAPLAGFPVCTILADRAGAVWFGTVGYGLARLDAGKLSQWTREDGPASQFIRTVFQDTAGTIWVGSSGGLTRRKDGRFFTFTPAHGIPDGPVSQILDDHEGHLWLGTNRGILRASLEALDAVAAGRANSLDVLALNAGDGLPSLECTGGYHPAGLRLSDGRLCFGTVAGVAIIDPKRFAATALQPPAVIEEIAIDGTALTPTDGRTVIPADAGRVEFQFTALHLSALERLRFRYRMDGLEQRWQEAGSARRASYTHLPPGEFRFEVTASADGSAWSTPAAVALRVLAPWWKTPWAFAFATLLSLGIIAGVVRFFTRRRLQRRLRTVEAKLALERERTRIARDIHDDLGATLTQISLLSATGQEKRDEPKVVSEQFTAITTATGELVQSLDAIVWAVNPRHDTLESLARYITRFAGDFCAQSPVRLRLDVPPELPDAVLSSEVRHNVFLAAKEALNNALRHAAATEIRIRIAVESSHFTIAIEDEGRGFSPAPQDHGNGLENMRRRLADCGGTCEISSAAGRGTTVHFKIPLPHST